jgi:hypothetical protein
MAAAPVVAPDAPAAWGQPVQPVAMAAYLDQLAAWREHRRAELGELDAAALASGDASATGDVTLAMALWQTVATRADELVRTWDGGRVGTVELTKLSALIWGRTHAATSGQSTTAAANGVSLPEACRLSDAVTAQLRQRLALTGGGGDVAAQLTSLRASVERVRDLVRDARPPVRDDAAERLVRLDRRVGDATDRARRGADVGGLLGSLQSELAVCERDLIVAAARARDDDRDHERALTWRRELADRARAVTALADACVAQVAPAPVLGIPNVDALGPVPDDADAVDAYLVRLGAVERALAHVADVYRAPVAELADLRGLLDASHAQAAARGRDALPEVAALAHIGTQLVTETPVDLVRTRGVVQAYRVLLESGSPARPSSAPTRPTAVRPAPPTSPGRTS